MLIHVNAQEVFPPEIVEEIQKYFSRGYLWIPKRNSSDKKRQREKRNGA